MSQNQPEPATGGRFHPYPLRIPHQLFAELKLAAAHHSRSIQGELIHMIRLGIIDYRRELHNEPKLPPVRKGVLDE